MNTVNPKAGTLKQTSSRSLSRALHELISKAASLLLIIALAFSAMAFDQGDSMDSNFDTNYAKKAKTVEMNKAVTDSCCLVSKPVIPGMKRAVYLNLPDRRTLMAADRETMLHFMKSIRESWIRQFWNGPAENQVKTADEEVEFNFELENAAKSILPNSKDLAEADEEMSIDFARSVASRLQNPSSKYSAESDDGMNQLFALDNFKMSCPSNEMIADADAGMNRDFESTNNPRLNMASTELIAKADEGMTRMIQMEKKIQKGKSIAKRK